MKQDDRTAELPSRRLAHELREAIKAGELAPGDRLPSERDLAAQHQVARNTAREAMRLLGDEGLVTAAHGRGVFVREQRRLMRLGAERYSRRLRAETGVSPFHAEVALQGRTPSARCLSIERVTPPEDIAERLNVDPARKSVVRRENWYYSDDEPVQIGVTWIPWDIARGNVLGCSDRLGPGDLYERFAEHGHQVTKIREEITARMPTPAEVAGLAIPDGVPVLEVLHTSIDQDGRSFEATQFTMRSDLTGLDYKIPIEE